jgi:hypothetical protein
MAMFRLACKRFTCVGNVFLVQECDKAKIILLNSSANVLFSHFTVAVTCIQYGRFYVWMFSECSILKSMVS